MFILSPRNVINAVVLIKLAFNEMKKKCRKQAR